MANKRVIKIGSVRITTHEDELREEFGNLSRGHNVPCRFCGWLSVDHDAPDEEALKDGKKRKNTFRTTLDHCTKKIGYVPKNVREWRTRERDYQREIEAPRAPRSFTYL